MDYDDNDFQSQNLHLAAEGNNKFPPVLRPYTLPRFDFDDNLHGHLRFDSLVETEVFLGIEGSEDSRWIEDFSRSSAGIAFSSSAAEPCSISRHNNVWSEAASSESVEMLLKSVGQDETIPGQTISKGSDACDELGCMIKQMEPSLKHGDSSFSEAGDDLQPALQTGEMSGKFSGLKGHVGGDVQLVEDVSQTHLGEPSVDRTFKDPNAKNTGISVIQGNESKDDKQILDENQVEALVDQTVDDMGQDDKFTSGTRVDIVIPFALNTFTTSGPIDGQENTHFKSDIIDENAESLEGEKVGLTQEDRIDVKDLIENADASVTLHVEEHSTLDMQPREEEHAIGNSTANVSEPFDEILKGNSDMHMVEGCSEGFGEKIPFKTGTCEDIALSEGKLHDISSMPFVGDTTLKEHDCEVSNTDTRVSTSLETKMGSVVQIACDTVEKKDFLEIDCHPDTKILSSKSGKSLLLVEDGKGSDVKGEGAQNILGAEPMRVCEEHAITEHNDDYKCDQSVSAAAKLNTNFHSGCTNADCGDDGYPLVIKGADSSSFCTAGTENELASTLLSDTGSKSVDCVLLPSGKGLPPHADFDQKEVQESSSEASFLIMKTSGMTTEKGATFETGDLLTCEKVDQSLSVENTCNVEVERVDQTLCRATLEVGKEIPTSTIVSDSTVRKTGDIEAQVLSERVSTEASANKKFPLGDLSIQQNDKTLVSSVASTSKEPSQNLKDSDTKLVSEEKGSGHVAVHHVDGDPAMPLNSSFVSVPSSTSEESQSKNEKDGVKRSKDQSASASGVINGEANKKQSISHDTKGNDASPGDRSFTFKVPPLADLSEKEAGKNWQPFSTMHPDKISSKAMKATPSTSSLSKVGAKAAQEAKLQASEKENVRSGSKGTSERKTRRGSGKSTGKEAAKKGLAAKEMNTARLSERSDRTSNVSLSSAGISQLVQSNERQHYGHMEVFHQPFTDLQQVQLRAQIFVYGALIQGTTPDEAYMMSAFGGPDGGRTIWENAWRACMERVNSQKSHLVSPETPLQSRLGAKTSNQSIKHKVPSSPASWSTSKGTPSSTVNPMIPLSSPLWSISAPSGDALQPTGVPRGAVMDYQQAISPLHSPPIRNFVGHNAPWMPQSPFRGPWVPQTSAFDGGARFPVLSITETVNLTPVRREASGPHSSGMKQVSTVPMVQSGSHPNIFAGTPVLDTRKATVTPGQRSADPKPRKRKKSIVSEDPGQIILHPQAEPLLATVAASHASTAAIISPATIVSKSSTDKFITSVPADHLSKGDPDQRATLSEETLCKHKEAQKQAEDAAGLAAAAVNRSQEIWNQLDKHKNSGLEPDVETKLTSAAVAIAAAAAVAKAAAAAANVASNAALQAKLMADEALVSSGYRNSIPTIVISSSTSSSSVIVAAREAARRRVEAASAASKRAENMDAIVKAAELAAEAVSQAGKIVAMGEPFRLTDLIEAGPEAYWKIPQASPEPVGAIREHIENGGVEAPGSSVRHPKEVQLDKREKQSGHGMSPTLREMARESLEDRSRLRDGSLGLAATSGKDKKGQKSRKALYVAKTKGDTSESEIGIGSPSRTTQTEHEKAWETSKDTNIREGTRVEVLKDGVSSGVAWFLADILNLKDGKAYLCYNELRSEDGDKLKEWVELEGEADRAPKIRIARTITAMPFEGTRKRRRAAMGDYNWSVGDRVDAWMQDSWWEGVITETNKKDGTSFTVHFPAQGETSVVKAWLLRPSLMWKNGSWVEWSSSLDNNSPSHEGDTPQEKRPRLGGLVVEAKGKDKLSENVDVKESWKPDMMGFSASEKMFNIGKSTRDESQPDSLRMIRTGLRKEGSRVIFGVPKPGKKRKFMEVSKHYVADQSSKTNEANDSTKFTKYLMPQGSEPRGPKNKIEPKEKRMAVSRPKVLKSGKLPSVSCRTIPQKDNLSNTRVSEPGDSVSSNVSKFKDSISHAENISAKHNLMEFRSFSSSDGTAVGPILFSSVALSSDAPPKKTSTSNAKSERVNKGKIAPAAGKLAKIEEEKVNGSSTKTISDAEPRRSNRRIQPTSRLLEGLQSSLIITKIPSVSHDKTHKSQSRSTRGNN